MSERAPFHQLRFEELPEDPRVPHGWDAVTHHEVLVDSVPFGRIRVHWVEQGQGEPLLLIHGLMWRAYSWRYAIGPLAERYRVIALDLPGAGQSEAPAASLTPEALAVFLGELVDALGIRGCRAIGNSMGGYLSMTAALADPGLFSRLVNLHSPGIPEPRLYALWFAMRVPLARRGFEAFVARDPERWCHTNVHYYDETLKSRTEARMLAEPLRTPAGRRAFSKYLGDTMSPWALRRFVKALEARGAAGFPIPLQLIYAESDPMVPPRVGQRLAELLPGAEMVWLSKASHFAHVDATQAFLDAARRFLD